jgi:hypothetical protein
MVETTDKVAGKMVDVSWIVDELVDTGFGVFVAAGLEVVTIATVAVGTAVKVDTEAVLHATVTILKKKRAVILQCFTDLLNSNMISNQPANGLRLSRRGNWQKKAWLDYKPVRADKAKA